MSASILIGDCRETLKGVADASVDSVVCDPPYHLTSIVKRFGSENAAPAKSNGATGVYGRASKGFMGQTWDGGNVAFDPATWAEILRVLKPGGHLVAFSGTRTYHRMTVAIEDAGFEVRDSILDLVASDDPVRRFLESLTGPQIEAFFRCIEDSQFGGLLAWVYGSGFPKSLDVSKQIDKAAGAEREVIGSKGLNRFNGTRADKNKGRYGKDHRSFEEADALTAPATDAAREWQGWGTALKPSWEPICLARKPLIGTVAANVLAHGCGALNIDGCRIESSEVDKANINSKHAGMDPETYERPVGVSLGLSVNPMPLQQAQAHDLGRWPANLCHDGSEEVLAGFPDAAGPGGAAKPESIGTGRGTTYLPTKSQGPIYAGETGSAARFFYCAKATTDERGEGNNHPTVKPIALMRWLCRLVTPKGGTVLDPFMGSGSTGIAADAEQFNFIGCEMSADYAGIAEQRMRESAGMFAQVEIVSPPVEAAA